MKTEAAAELEAARTAAQEVIAFVQTEIAETQQSIDEEQTKVAVPDITDTPEPTPIKAEETGEPEVSEPENLLKVGELIKFGSYEQDNNMDNGAEEIEWQVLHVENGRALLISKYCLDAKPYHDDPYAEVTWEESTMRKWLNEDFYLNAFSEDEKIKIVMVTNKNPDNPVYATDGGNDTEDRIFLLSADEAEKYFADDEARKCEATAYAKEMGAVVYDYNEFTGAEYGGTSRWRLRTPGYQAFNVVYVDESGSIYNKTGNVGIVSDGAAVRPALWLDLAAEKLVY